MNSDISSTINDTGTYEGTNVTIADLSGAVTPVLRNVTSPTNIAVYVLGNTAHLFNLSSASNTSLETYAMCSTYTKPAIPVIPFHEQVGYAGVPASITPTADSPDVKLFYVNIVEGTGSTDPAIVATSPGISITTLYTITYAASVPPNEVASFDIFYTCNPAETISGMYKTPGNASDFTGTYVSGAVRTMVAATSADGSGYEIMPRVGTLCHILLHVADNGILDNDPRDGIVYDPLNPTSQSVSVTYNVSVVYNHMPTGYSPPVQTFLTLIPFIVFVCAGLGVFVCLCVRKRREMRVGSFDL